MLELHANPRGATHDQAAHPAADRQPARPEPAGLGRADSANREAGITAVKKKLQDACTDRKGSPDAASFEVVFEKTSENPNVPKPYYVDGRMKCELPG